MYTYPGKDVLKEDESPHIWIMIVNHSMGSPDKDHGDWETESYNLKKELFL